MPNALIVGGTRGIGAATAQLLRERGWDVTALGHKEFPIGMRVKKTYPLEGKWDAVVYSAGDIEAQWMRAFAFPMTFYQIVPLALADGGVAVAISSVAAHKPAKVNAHYAAAKAALESYAYTLAESDAAKQHNWKVSIVRFDLVRTEMLLKLPPETLEGRSIISADEAAQAIVRAIHASR